MKSLLITAGVQLAARIGWKHQDVQMAKRVFAALATGLALLNISGCATLNRGEPSAETANKSNGVVAASVTFTNGTHTNDAWFFVRHKGATDQKDSIRLDARTGLGGSPTGLFWNAVTGKGPDFPDSPRLAGRVLAVSLPPGEYELHSWEIYIQQMGGYGYIRPRVPPKPLTFEIKPGEVTYLGNLHLETLMGKNVFGLEIPASGVPLISSKMNRDAALLKTRFPMLQDWPMTDAQLDGQQWLPPKPDQGAAPD